MKSKFLFAALASITLAACSNDELVSEQQTSDNANAIAFRASVANTRANAVQVSDLQTSGFYAIALQSSTGSANNTNLWGAAQKFTYDGTNFVTDADIEWDIYETKFFASNIDPKTHDFNIPASGTTEQPKYVDFQPDQKIADQIDFVYASNKGSRSQFSAGIPLHFRHALAQVAVQAKCDKTTSKYLIKVKGYKLVYVCDKGTFTFGDPVYSTSDVTTPQPTSKFADLVTENAVASHTQYISNFYKGTGYPTSSVKLAEGVKDYIELNGEYQDIYGTLDDGKTSDGTAMIIPQEVKKMGYDDQNLGNGFYIALLVQIDKAADGDAVFPEMSDDNPSVRIAYRGLPKNYGYMAIPVDLTATEAGKKYIYKIDLTNGLGYVDPAKPGTTDPNDENYNPEDPDEQDPTKNTTNNEGGGTDPFDPGSQIVGSPFKFSVTMTTWDDTPTVINRDL